MLFAVYKVKYKPGMVRGETGDVDGGQIMKDLQCAPVSTRP